MSNARAPKRKEEYTSPSDIEVICDDILEKGMVLETMSGMKFPDAEMEEGVTKTTMLPEGGVAYTIFVKLCVQFILQALIAMIRTLFYYSLWYVLSHPSHVVRGLGLGLAF